MYSKQFLWIISNINVLKTKANLIDSSVDYRRENFWLWCIGRPSRIKTVWQWCKTADVCSALIDGHNVSSTDTKLSIWLWGQDPPTGWNGFVHYVFPFEVCGGGTCPWLAFELFCVPWRPQAESQVTATEIKMQSSLFCNKMCRKSTVLVTLYIRLYLWILYAHLINYKIIFHCVYKWNIK